MAKPQKSRNRRSFHSTLTGPTSNKPGTILWLPSIEDIDDPIIKNATGVDEGCCDHPVVLLGTDKTKTDAKFLVVTSFKGRLLSDKHEFNKEKRLEYLPISPSPLHPDNGLLLKLEGEELRKNSYVKIIEEKTISLQALEEHGDRRLTDSSYQLLLEKLPFKPSFFNHPVIKPTNSSSQQKSTTQAASTHATPTLAAPVSTIPAPITPALTIPTLTRTTPTKTAPARTAPTQTAPTKTTPSRAATPTRAAPPTRAPPPTRAVPPTRAALPMIAASTRTPTSSYPTLSHGQPSYPYANQLRLAQRSEAILPADSSYLSRPIVSDNSYRNNVGYGTVSSQSRSTPLPRWTSDLDRARKQRESRRSVLEGFGCFLLVLVGLTILGMVGYGGFLGVKAFIRAWPAILAGIEHAVGVLFFLGIIACLLGCCVG